MNVERIEPQIQPQAPLIREHENATLTPEAGEGPAAGGLSSTQWIAPVQTDSDVQEFTEQLAQVVNETLQAMEFSLKFVVDTKDQNLMIRVLDSEGKVIREIPPEEIQRIHKRLAEMAGVLFEERR
jgi:uncharacterized FlaG/YvyC family protein